MARQKKTEVHETIEVTQKRSKPVTVRFKNYAWYNGMVFCGTREFYRDDPLYKILENDFVVLEG